MNVLITGASGFIGQSLVKKLRERNHHVRVFTRGNPTQENEFRWNPNEQFIDEKALENLDAIIHLAGANISKRWTEKYKKELFESDFNEKINWILEHLNEHRNANFLGQILQHHTLQSTKYLSKWIEEKNSKNQ